MSSDPDLPRRPDDDEPDPLAAMLRALFGEGGEGALAGIDPEQLRAMLPPGLADMPGMPQDAAGMQAMFC